MNINSLVKLTLEDSDTLYSQSSYMGHPVRLKIEPGLEQLDLINLLDIAKMHYEDMQYALYKYLKSKNKNIIDERKFRKTSVPQHLSIYRDKTIKVTFWDNVRSKDRKQFAVIISPPKYKPVVSLDI